MDFSLPYHPSLLTAWAKSNTGDCVKQIELMADEAVSRPKCLANSPRSAREYHRRSPAIRCKKSMLHL
jgi:hypothetical protein